MGSLPRYRWNFAINFSIVSGWFPVVIVTVAIVSTVLAVGWWDGAWKMQLALGIPISLALTGLVALAIHVFNLVPDAFPNTFYLWVWLMMFSLVVAVLGFTKAHWALRTFSVLAIVFCVIAAFTVVNETYEYWPTLDRLFGKTAANFVALPELNAIRDAGARQRQAARPRRDHRDPHPEHQVEVRCRSTPTCGCRPSGSTPPSRRYRS